MSPTTDTMTIYGGRVEMEALTMLNIKTYASKVLKNHWRGMPNWPFKQGLFLNCSQENGECFAFYQNKFHVLLPVRPSSDLVEGTESSKLVL
jgi:hypothetical protein